jgi:hypothetical protein
MKTKIILFTILSVFSFALFAQNEKNVIDDLLKEWHQAAANADQESYFDFIAEDGVYIGTDATENWRKDEFFEWSRSYFENGKAWSFNSIERNIYFSENNSMSWFDEQLEFSGGILRGSGVLVKEKSGWKLKQYVLSLPVPNDKFKEVLEVINSNTSNDVREKEE